MCSLSIWFLIYLRAPIEYFFSKFEFFYPLEDVKSCIYFRYTILIVRVGWNLLVQNRQNSLPCSIRTFRQGSCNQRVGCLRWLGSRPFKPNKQSGPRLLSMKYWIYVRFKKPVQISDTIVGKIWFVRLYLWNWRVQSKTFRSSDKYRYLWINSMSEFSQKNAWVWKW